MSDKTTPTYVIWREYPDVRWLATLGTVIDGDQIEICTWSREKGKKGWTDCKMVPVENVKQPPLDTDRDNIVNWLSTGEIKRIVGLPGKTMCATLYNKDRRYRVGLEPRQDFSGREYLWYAGDVINYLEKHSRSRRK